MLLARLGTAKAKPNGLFIVPTDAPGPTTSASAVSKSSGLSPVMKFMATVPLRSLPGVGRKLMKKLLARSAEKPKAMARLLETVSVDHHNKEGGEEYVDEEDEEGGNDSYALPHSVTTTI